MRSAMDQKVVVVVEQKEQQQEEEEEEEEEEQEEQEEQEEEEAAWEKNDREWLRVTLIELLRDANLNDLDLLRSLDKDGNQAVERKEWMRCIKRIWVPPPLPKVVAVIAPASHKELSTKIVASSSEIVASSSSEIMASSSELIFEMIPEEETEIKAEIKAETAADREQRRWETTEAQTAQAASDSL